MDAVRATTFSGGGTAARPPHRHRQSDQSAESRPAPTPRGAWVVPAVFIVAAAMLTAVYALHPGDLVGLAAYGTLSCSVGGAVYSGTRRYRPSIRTGWYLLAVAPPLGSVGMVLRRLLATSSGTLLPLLPDIVTIIAYLLFTAGLFVFLSARRGAGADSAVDGGLMAVAALLLSWSMLIEPVLANAQLPVASKVINGAYPTISVAIFFLGALLAMTEPGSTAS